MAPQCGKRLIYLLHCALLHMYIRTSCIGSECCWHSVSDSPPYGRLSSVAMSIDCTLLRWNGQFFKKYNSNGWNGVYLTQTVFIWLKILSAVLENTALVQGISCEPWTCAVFFHTARTPFQLWRRLHILDLVRYVWRSHFGVFFVFFPGFMWICDILQ